VPDASRSRITLLGAALLVLSGCSTSVPTPGPTGAGPSSAAATATFATDLPSQGATVTSAPVTLPPATAVPATPEPTSPPATPGPTLAPTFRTFGDGTLKVGVDIKPGTYRLREPAALCVWGRLKGFSGTPSDILAGAEAANAYDVVTIKSTDAGFLSHGCGLWSSDLSRVTSSKNAIDGNGTYIVGTDITAGTWKSTGLTVCSWESVSGFTGSASEHLADGLHGGPTIVTIRSTDKGFITTGCGTWARQ
jgi:hypothetical protein